MRERGEIVATLLVSSLFLALGTFVPLFLALRVHPLVGCLAATGAAALWARLVPPPSGVSRESRA